MRVGGPGVGFGNALDEPSQRRARRRPQPERAVHVTPRIVLTREPRDHRHGVDRAGVDLAYLGDDDGRPLAARQHARELGGAHATLVVGRHELHPTAAQPEHPQRGEDRGVRLGANQHTNRRGTEQAVGLDVPARIGERAMTCRGQTCEVGHLATGRQAHPSVIGQTEDVQQPFAGDLLRHRGRGATRVAGRVLVPDRRQPVGRDRRVESAADDEAEVPGTLRPDEAGIRRRDQLLDHLQRWSRPVLERNPQRRAQLVERRTRADGTLGERRQILGRDLSSAAKQLGIHPATLLRLAIHSSPTGSPAWRETFSSMQSSSDDVRGRQVRVVVLGGSGNRSLTVDPVRACCAQLAIVKLSDCPRERFPAAFVAVTSIV